MENRENAMKKDKESPSKLQPERITVMQSGGLLTDMRLICQNQTFYAHKLITAASSKYLQRIFKYEQDKGTNSIFTVVMNAVQPTDVANILKYIYVGEVQIRTSETEGFLKAAEILRIDKILKRDKNKKKRKENRKSGGRDAPKSKPVTPALKIKAEKFTTATNHETTKRSWNRPAVPLPEKLSKPDTTSSVYLKTPNLLRQSSRANILPNRVTSLRETSGPRAPSPHPKTDTEVKAKVFYVTPLVKKLQWTIPEKYSISTEAKSEGLTKSDRRNPEQILKSLRLSRGCSSQFSTITQCQVGAGTSSSTARGISTKRRDGRQPRLSIGKNEQLKKHPKVRLNKKVMEIQAQPSRVTEFPKIINVGKNEVKNIPISGKYPDNADSTSGLGSFEKSSSSSKNRPNPKLDESFCSKKISRASKKAWLRRQLEDDVSAICHGMNS